MYNSFHENITRATSFEKKSFSENLCSLKIVSSYKHIGTCTQDNNPFSEKLSGQKKVGYKYIGKILARVKQEEKICQNILINIINKVQVFYEGLKNPTKFLS